MWFSAWLCLPAALLIALLVALRFASARKARWRPALIALSLLATAVVAAVQPVHVAQAGDSRDGRLLSAPAAARLTRVVLAERAAPASKLPPAGPQITITPGDTTVSGSGSSVSLSVTITICSQTVDLDDGTYSITLDGTDVSGSFSTYGSGLTGCVWGRTSTGSVTLDRSLDGVHIFSAAIDDLNGYHGSSRKFYTFRWPGYTPPEYAVRVVRDPATPAAQTAAPSTSRSAVFTLYNAGSRPATYALAATCSGGATSCSVTSSVTLDTTSAGRSATETVSFTSGSAGDTETVRLRATNSGSGLSADADSASASVTVRAATANNSAGIVITHAGAASGAGPDADRSSCLAVAVGPAAASQCGDLRLVHALPTVTTRGTPHTPILLYASGTATGLMSLGVDVTPVTNLGTLTGVSASVMSGSTSLGSGSWSGSDWTSGATRHIDVPLDVSGLSTGLASYTLTITYTWTGSGPTHDAATGTIAVVNRAGSPFGAGWWLAGLEQLVASGSNWLWIGGDGSTRLYTQSTSTLWRAASLSHPDSITLSTGTYSHRLPDGTQVEFNSTGQETRIHRLVGPSTYFYYTSGNITTLALPTADAVDWDTTNAKYNFSYTSTSVTATLHAGGATRTTTGTLSSGNLTQLQDPDASTVGFGYSGSISHAIVSRTDQLSHATSFSLDVGGHVTGHRITVGGVALVDSIQPAESRGMPSTANASAEPLDSVYTLLDGPRTDVPDVTRIWVNGAGAPTRVRTADGWETRVTYDGTFPALSDEVDHPGGSVSKAWYDSRGLADSTAILALRSASDGAAVSRTTWHSTLAVPTAMTSASGAVSSYSYNSDGTLSTSQIGTSSSTQSAVNYYTTSACSGGLAGLYAASSLPGRTERDSVVYDCTLGNPIRVKDRTGVWHAMARDALGQVVLDSTEVASGIWKREALAYDAMGRVTGDTSYGPVTSYTAPGHSELGTVSVPADTLIVHTAYDAVGRVSWVSRRAQPNRVMTGSDSVTSWTSYDEAGRKTGVSSSQQDETHLTYDPAGNTLTEEDDDISSTRTMTYDAMNRLATRAIRQHSITSTYCSFYTGWGVLGTCNFSFPLSTVGATLTIPGDTAVFAYDAAGHVIQADNAAARIRRTYTPGGLLATDTLRLRVLHDAGSVPTSNFTSHVYGLTYSYDVDGMRTGLTHPDVIDPCSGACPAEADAYDVGSGSTETGRLTSVTDVLGHTVSFAYTAAGQLDDISYPGGIHTTSTFDAEGRPVTHAVGTTSLPGWILSDTLNYDPLGRISTGRGRIVNQATQQSMTMAYSGLGALAMSDWYPDGGTPKLEQFFTDAMGNADSTERYGVHLGGSNDEPSPRIQLYTTGRVATIETPLSDSTSYNEFTHTWYDAEGRATQGGYYLRDLSDPSDPPPTYQQTASYYDGLGELVQFERHTGELQQESTYGDPQGIIERYRYDALGRRVLVQTIRSGECTAAGCEPTVTRVVWDGNQMLYELRARGGDSTSATYTEADNASGNGEFSATNAYGQTLYTYAPGGGLDQPLVVIRKGLSGTPTTLPLFPHLNWRGLYETATDTAGNEIPTVGTGSHNIAWPGAAASAFLGATQRTDVPEWFGGVLTSQADASGLMYRRNRYYDPASGKFTTADPIEIGGGLNVYGFGGGDPINESDPTGLDPCTQEQLDHGWTNVKNGDKSECSSSDPLPAVTTIANASDAPDGRQSRSHDCSVHAGSFVLALGGETAEIGALHYANDFLTVASKGAAAAPEAARGLALNAALVPPATGLQMGLGSMSASHYEFSGNGNSLYELAKMVPVLGAGLELGETINACSGRMP